MKKKIIAIVMLVLIILATLTACSKIDYGKPFNTFGELKDFLEQNDMKFNYPVDFDSEKDIKYNYIAQYDNSQKKYSGYKIYRFSSPFYVTVYAYSTANFDVMSDDIERLTEVKKVSTENGEVTFFRGDGRDNSLFIIGTINIGSNRYECRITPDKSFTDGKLTNIITLENENFEKAIELALNTLKSLG